MLFEILMTLGATAYGGSTVLSYIHKNKAAALATAAKLPVLDPATAMPTGDTATLVVELFRTDEGWKRMHERTPERETWEHETGVRFTKYTNDYLGHTSAFVYIKSEKGVYENVDTSSDDDKIMLRELKAFQTRQRDAKQRALTRALANRIVARESGVQTVLGGSSESTDDDASSVGSERTENNSVSAGLLSYNEATRTIESPVRGDSLRLKLGASLERRYGIRQVKDEVISDLLLGREYWEDDVNM